MILGNEEFTDRKDHRKRIRVVIQIIALLGALALFINAFFTLKTYHPYSESLAAGNSEDTGFIALSYFGVDRMGDTSTLIGEEQLRRQLKALRDQGYVTITQKDIEAYYKDGKPLPQRSLFLMFEDGRRDTAIFAQDILEEFNYKASMMTYPEKFEKKDPKFLMPKELKDMQESSFWELGSNGYRLEFINVFDRYNNYIGEIDPLKFSMMHDYLGRRYNHFLMDYIRDKNGMPKESYNHMVSRIGYDYERLRDIYTEQLGAVPELYVLMHSNTGKFGNNDRVSAVNERWIRELFQMNFNREGYCFNQRNSSIYDLTRMQPQPYWPINHLLMRIKYDINQPIQFIQGNEEKQKKWELIDGASEIKEETSLLTSLPEGDGLARLKDSGDYTDVKVSAYLEGNSFGTQQIYLRASDDLKRYISVGIINGELIVEEVNNGDRRELYKEKLSIIDGEKPLSVEEDKRDAEVRELEAFARYAPSAEEAREYAARAEKRRNEPAASIEEGADPYKGPESFHARQNRKLTISLKNDTISVQVDGKAAAADVKVADTQRGALYLHAAWNKDAWSQRNLADDVYDGIYRKLIVTSNTGESSEKVLFTSELQGWEKYQFRAKQVWEAVLNWFLKHL